MQTIRVNKSCAYFPCHKGLEDCTFCYCPFYPCLNKRLGNYVFLKKTGKNIWSCQACVWIHKENVVNNIFKSIRASSINPHKDNQKLRTRNVGVIILGHGSKVKKANATISKVIKEIRRKGAPKIIEPSYLQMYSPNFHASVKKAINKGCKKIVVVPFFLFTGNHVSRDIPREIEREAKLYQGVEFIYAKNIGDDPRISEIVLDCIKKAI